MLSLNALVHSNNIPLSTTFVELLNALLIFHTLDKLSATDAVEVARIFPMLISTAGLPLQ